jgi:hypothetical protein
VYGAAGKASFLTTQPFEVNYSQITDVSKSSMAFLHGNGNLKIDCGPYKFTCWVNEPDKIVELIKSKI